MKKIMIHVVGLALLVSCGKGDERSKDSNPENGKPFTVPNSGSRKALTDKVWTSITPGTFRDIKSYLVFSFEDGNCRVESHCVLPDERTEKATLNTPCILTEDMINFPFTEDSVHPFNLNNITLNCTVNVKAGAMRYFVNGNTLSLQSDFYQGEFVGSKK